jgi:hypothetical protein
LARLADWAFWRSVGGDVVGYSSVSPTARWGNDFVDSPFGPITPKLFRGDLQEKQTDKLIASLPVLEQTAVIAFYLLSGPYRDRYKTLWAVANGAPPGQFEDYFDKAVSLLEPCLKAEAKRTDLRGR